MSTLPVTMTTLIPLICFGLEPIFNDKAVMPLGTAMCRVFKDIAHSIFLITQCRQLTLTIRKGVSSWMHAFATVDIGAAMRAGS